jgi:hypothetical protein
LLPEKVSLFIFIGYMHRLAKLSRSDFVVNATKELRYPHATFAKYNNARFQLRNCNVTAITNNVSHTLPSTRLVSNNAEFGKFVSQEQEHGL